MYLVSQVVEQEDHEVVDDVCLVALPACVHVDGNAGVLQRNPLCERERERVGEEDKERNGIIDGPLHYLNDMLHDNSEHLNTYTEKSVRE